MNATSKLLAAVVVMQGLTLAVVLTNPTLPVAHAQPTTDPGVQRTQMVEEQRKTNDKLDRLISILDSGKLQVKATVSDDGKGKANGK
jgi:hypothetical protein